MGGRKGGVSFGCAQRPSVLLSPPLWLFFPGPEKQGDRGNLVYNFRGKKPNRETSGKFCNVRQEEGQTPWLGEDELAASQAWPEQAWGVCVSGQQGARGSRWLSSSSVLSPSFPSLLLLHLLLPQQ